MMLWSYGGTRRPSGSHRQIGIVGYTPSHHRGCPLGLPCYLSHKPSVSRRGHPVCQRAQPCAAYTAKGRNHHTVYVSTVTCPSFRGRSCYRLLLATSHNLVSGGVTRRGGTGGGPPTPLWPRGGGAGVAFFRYLANTPGLKNHKITASLHAGIRFREIEVDPRPKRG